MKLTEEQIKQVIREATKKVVMEYAYHEKQQRPSEEEHAEWLRKKADAKKRYYDSKKKDDKETDGKAIDRHDYKHGKGNFPVMAKESVKLSSSDFHKFITESVKKVIKEMLLPDEGCCEDSKNEKYEPKFVWVDSRVKGVGSSWYYGGSDQMSLDELQMFLDKYNAVAVYRGEFYDNVRDIPFKPERNSIDTFGMPTGRYTESEPTVTVVPKGTEWEDCIYSKRFKFPEGFKNDFDYRNEQIPERNWKKNK